MPSFVSLLFLLALAFRLAVLGSKALDERRRGSVAAKQSSKRNKEPSTKAEQIAEKRAEIGNWKSGEQKQTS